MQQVARKSADHLRQLAIQYVADVTCGFIRQLCHVFLCLFFNTPLGSIYGENVSRLKAIKAAVDPTNIMGLAGGFKF